jgi:hypothetical protein
LKGENPRIETAAKDYFKPEELKVFDKLPADQVNTRIQETFVQRAPKPSIPATKEEWQAQRDHWMAELREKCFAGWPDEKTIGANELKLHRLFQSNADQVQLTGFRFDSQPEVTLRLYLLLPDGVPREKLRGLRLMILDSTEWGIFASGMRFKFDKEFLEFSPEIRSPTKYAYIRQMVTDDTGLAIIAPRGVAEAQWTAEPKNQIHIRRRFMLLGQTLDGMRVWDLRRAVQSVRAIDGLSNVGLSLGASRKMAGIALYAALFEPRIEAVEVEQLPASHLEGPDFLNVLRILDVPQTVAMVAENSRVSIDQGHDSDWEYPLAVAKTLGWNKRITVRTTPAAKDLSPSASTR